jgi:hypothetical protein
LDDITSIPIVSSFVLSYYYFRAFQQRGGQPEQVNLGGFGGMYSGSWLSVHSGPSPQDTLERDSWWSSQREQFGGWSGVD